MSRAISIFSCLARFTSVCEVLQWCRGRDGSRCGRLPRSRSPTGCPSSPGSSLDGVVLALAKAFPDRERWGAGRGRQSPFPPRNPSVWLRRARCHVALGRLTRIAGRAHTSGKARPFPVDQNFQFAVVAGLERGIRVALNHLRELVLQCQLSSSGVIARRF